MSEEEERRVGAEAHPKIMKEFGGAHGSLQLRSYVNKVGKALSQLSEMPNLPYNFMILKEKK
jgi:predicted Zn-dependent protease